MEIIVCAMKCEMDPLQKYFGDAFKFVNCGMKAKHLEFVDSLDKNDHVYNIGICGGFNIGEIYLASKIIGSKTYYPDYLFETNIKQCELKTIDYLASNDLISNNPNTLFDQEAALIYEAASKKLGPHQISFIKVVSDNGIGVKQLSENDISKIIESKIPEIENIIKTHGKNTSDPKKIESLDRYTEQLKCTATMKAQLAQLLRYAQICNIDVEDFFKDIKVTSKKDSLQFLKSLKNFLLSEDK